MKKIWYLSNADKKDKRVARLFVYENNGQQKAQLDLMSFSDKPGFSRVDICFYVPQEITVKKMRCQPEDAFIKQALHGKGILPDDCVRHIEEPIRNLQLRIIWGGKVYDSFSCKEDLPPEAEQEALKEADCEIQKDGISEESESDCRDSKAEYAADQLLDEQGFGNSMKLPKSGQETSDGINNGKQWLTTNKNVLLMGSDRVGINGSSEEQPEIGQEMPEGFWLDEDLEDDSEKTKEIEMPQTVCEPQKEGARRIVELGILEEEMIFRSFVHNSFLLHGYYNYGHLIIDEKNGSARLGVPGNYYEREKAVASMFGFPDFEPAKDKIVGNGTFGYYFTAYT